VEPQDVLCVGEQTEQQEQTQHINAKQHSTTQNSGHKAAQHRTKENDNEAVVKRQ
jgi:hypothetical protein